MLANLSWVSNLFLVRPLKWIHSKLGFDGWSDYPQFATSDNMGRGAMIGTLIGICLGSHATALVFLIYIYKKEINLSDSYEAEYNLIFQWIGYIISMCLFHLGEFFVTALYTPRALSASSFLIQHSLAYTAAFISSAIEFWTRFFLFKTCNSLFASRFGLALVVFGQLLRSIAMKTCGEYFNHYIQHTNEDSHRLITNGIYHYLRHPSYVGYFYWAIGTQLLLSNPINFFLFAWAAWRFFRERIPYEEQTLIRQYKGYYVDYMKQTWIGIPFISSKFPSTDEINEMTTL